MSNNEVFVIGGLPESLLNFRGELLKALKIKGLDVTGLAAKGSVDFVEQLNQRGVRFIPLPIERNGLNPLSDLKLLIRLILIYRKHKPRKVIAYTIKPVIWGGIAARLVGIQFYGLITGLGYAFQGDSLKRKLLTRAVSQLYRLALKKSEAVIFQNKDNKNVFVGRNIVERSKCHVVNGSGVDTDKYPFSALPSASGAQDIKFLCVARLLKDKGLKEYAAAADIVKSKYPSAECFLVGPEDPSPNGIPLDEVTSWKSISYLGETNNVISALTACDVYVLPSYHEGLPRSTLEAMSVGRPIVTTNAVGCRDTVQEGVNGFKVPVASVDELAEKMIWCIENRNRLSEMGQASRSYVMDKFDVTKVNSDILNILELNK